MKYLGLLDAIADLNGKSLTMSLVHSCCACFQSANLVLNMNVYLLKTIHIDPRSKYEYNILFFPQDTDLSSNKDSKFAYLAVKTSRQAVAATENR